MALSNSKLPATHNPFSVFLMIFIFFLLLIINVKSNSFSFNFASFDPNAQNIGLGDEVSVAGGVLQLTKKDNRGKPLQNTVGLAGYVGPVRLHDKIRGLADFTTEFSFVMNPQGSELHGDGMTFFLASLDFEFPDGNSSGGFLGLFTPETAFNASKNQIVAVEFDSFANEWDPNPVSESPHIGIDVNSIRSVATTQWRSDIELDGAIAKARISYNSESLELSVILTYPNGNPNVNGGAFLRHTIDLRTVLSEWVLIGFSGATGELVETHDILSWSFTSIL